MIKSNFDESDYTPVRLVLNTDRKLSFAEYEEENDEEPSQASKTQRAMEILEVMLGESGQAAVSEIHAVMADEGASAIKPPSGRSDASKLYRIM